MERPSRTRISMEVAYLFSKRSTCNRAHVGALIVRDGRILVSGYNGPPAGLPHCNPACEQIHGGGCTLSVHAEANTIAYAARYGIRVEGTHLFCTHLPCVACAHLIINAGITQVTYDQDYRIKNGELLLENAGVDIMTMHDRLEEETT